MKMKLRSILLLTAICIFSLAISTNCKKDLTSTCLTTTACPGKSFKTCANALGGGYYEYNGVKYSWTGSDPSSAATALVAAMGCK
jgi:hypothetical protein